MGKQHIWTEGCIWETKKRENREGNRNEKSLRLPVISHFFSGLLHLIDPSSEGWVDETREGCSELHQSNTGTDLIIEGEQFT